MQGTRAAKLCWRSTMMREDTELVRQLLAQVTAEVAACVQRVSPEALLEAEEMLAVAPRVFVAGSGRTGLCMRSFAMRLMHLGKIVHVVGEATTPSIAVEDLLVVGSGSGRTASLLAMAERAQGLGARMLLFTSVTDSPLAAFADQLFLIPAPSHKSVSKEILPPSVQPMGALFEQSLFLLNDTLIMGLMARMDVDAGQMARRHANLE